MACDFASGKCLKYIRRVHSIFFFFFCTEGFSQLSHSFHEVCFSRDVFVLGRFPQSLVFHGEYVSGRILPGVPQSDGSGERAGLGGGEHLQTYTAAQVMSSWYAFYFLRSLPLNLRLRRGDVSQSFACLFWRGLPPSLPW